MLAATLVLVVLSPLGPSAVLLPGDSASAPQVLAAAVDDDDEEGDEEETKDAGGGNTALGAMAGGATAFGGLCAANIVFSLLSGIIGWIPVVGMVYTLAFPFLIAAVGGTAGWAVGSMVAKRRLPLLPFIGALSVATCGGLAFNTVMSGIGVACMYGGIIGGSMIGGDAYMLAAVAGMACGGLCNVVGCLGLLGAYGGGGGAAAALVALLGRPAGAGESVLQWDMVNVPAFDEDDGEDEEEDPRPKKRSKRSRKVVEADDDEE